MNNPHESSGSWIAIEPLRVVASRLYELRASDGIVPAGYMAQLARRLVACETEVGGPYAEPDGRIDRAANEGLARFFALYSVRLPGLSAWLEKNSPVIPLSGALDGFRPTVPTRRRTRGTASPAAHDVRAYFEELADSVRLPAVKTWQKISAVDSAREITGIALYFHESLCGDVPVFGDKSLAASLAMANFYTWMAYTIYDDFIDEDGDPRTLPVANIAHRQAVSLYARTTVPTLVSGCFEAMDHANAWELAHCRFTVARGHITVGQLPEYGDFSVLARRAGAHVLGPKIVAESAALSPAAQEIITKALDHYLIARQLEDDLHDWVDDLRAGHISPVVAHLLRAAAITPGDYPVKALTARLKPVFWHTALGQLSERAQYHIGRVYDLERRGIISAHSSFMREIVAPIERSIVAGRRRHADEHSFLRAYASVPAAGV